MSAKLQKILLASLAVLVLLSLVPMLVMSSWPDGTPMMFGMMGYRAGYGTLSVMGGMARMWISALIIFGLGILTGWVVFAKK